MARLLSVCVIAVVLVSAPSLVNAKEAQGARFIVQAVQGILAELQMGQLAQRNGQSPEVKAFGQLLDQDHSAANQRATAVAKQLGMPTPTEPNKKQRADYAKMAKATGAAFDRASARHMVTDHKKDLAQYKNAAGLKNDPAAGYASETLPSTWRARSRS